MDAQETGARVIVVGVDGSDGSRAALRWAAEEGARRHDTVRAVYAWGYPYIPGPEGSAVFLNPADVTRDATERLEATIAEALPDEAARAAVERYVIDGSAADVLVEQSKDADLVVVGARGHGGFVGLLLGSVSGQVVNHAHCPVVVVPRERQTRR